MTDDYSGIAIPTSRIKALERLADEWFDGDGEYVIEATMCTDGDSQLKAFHTLDHGGYPFHREQIWADGPPAEWVFCVATFRDDSPPVTRYRTDIYTDPTSQTHD